jgi:hypothetical protein
MGRFDRRNSIRCEEIETESKIDDCAYDERLRRLRAVPSPMEELCSFQCALGIGLPEVDAWTEPVIVVFAGSERFACQESLADSLLTAVVAQNEG